MKIYFSEKQKFTQWWFWLFIAPLGFLNIMGIYKQLILGEEFGEHPISDLGLILFSIFIFLFLVLFFCMYLKTEINQNEVSLKFFPFITKRVKWHEIKKAEVITYGFVGGWGIRLWTKYGTVYNIKGNKGLAIELLNGKKFLIGTQKEADLKNIVKKAHELKLL